MSVRAFKARHACAVLGILTIVLFGALTIQTFMQSKQPGDISSLEDIERISHEATEVQSPTQAAKNIAVVSDGQVSDVHVSHDEGSIAYSYEASCDLVQASTSVLNELKERFHARLVTADYLDLFGNVWTCTVMQPESVDTYLLRQNQNNVQIFVYSRQIKLWAEHVAALKG